MEVGSLGGRGRGCWRIGVLGQEDVLGMGGGGGWWEWG